MIWQTVHPIARRNLLLAMSGALLVLAIMLRPATLLFFLSLRELANLAILALVAFFAAISTTTCGELWLPTPGNPWYIRRGTMILLPAMLLGMTTLVAVFGDPAFCVFGTGPLMSQTGPRLEFAALQIFWIVVLEWPHYEGPSWPRTGTERGERHLRRPTAYL